jgi:hypothetical protein
MSIGALDPIVLGHNSFFGVNHLSRERGRQRDALFEDTARILDMMRTAASLDVGAMMMSTHPARGARGGGRPPRVRAARALDVLSPVAVHHEVHPAGE